MTVDKIIDALIKREGGYVDHPADRGGPTKYGITQDTARRAGYLGAMRDLTRAQAVEIYRVDYWQRPGCADVADISMPIALELFDSGVNCGRRRAGEWLQRTLNVLNRQARAWPDLVIDGAIGPASRAALQAALVTYHDAETLILRGQDGLQVAHYITLAEARPSQEAFTPGWLRHRIGPLI